MISIYLFFSYLMMSIICNIIACFSIWLRFKFDKPNRRLIRLKTLQICMWIIKIRFDQKIGIDKLKILQTLIAKNIISAKVSTSCNRQIQGEERKGDDLFFESSFLKIYSKMLCIFLIFLKCLIIILIFQKYFLI